MERTQETFIDIAGYEGMYQIGTQGTVISLERERGGKGNCTYYTVQREMIQATNKFGYVSVRLTNEIGVHKKIDIHRLVALNLIDNPFNKPQVNHIDGDKSNNQVDNLEWTTQAENMAHAKAMGLMPRGESHWKSILTKKQVMVIKDLISTDMFSNIQIGTLVETSPKTISKIKTGVRWAHV